jgi:hypothetical protein
LLLEPDPRSVSGVESLNAAGHQVLLVILIRIIFMGEVLKALGRLQVVFDPRVLKPIAHIVLIPNTVKP